jgi:hypothetical protein
MDQGTCEDIGFRFCGLELLGVFDVGCKVWNARLEKINNKGSKFK